MQHAQTAVVVAIKGSEQEYQAKKNFLSLQRQQALKDLEDQRQAELAKVKDGENRAGERIRINDAINQKIADTNAKYLHEQHITEILDAVKNYSGQVFDIIGQFNQAAANRENATAAICVCGFLTGDSHSTGGMPVINRKTGQVEAEVEGGEVILSKKTVNNNWDYIAPLLNSSMNDNGKRITAWWQTRSYQPINFPGLQNVFVQKRFFESGGVVPANNGQAAGNVQTVVVKDEETKAIMLAVLYRLNNPVAPVVNNTISLKQIHLAEDQQARIVADAAFR